MQLEGDQVVYIQFTIHSIYKSVCLFVLTRLGWLLLFFSKSLDNGFDGSKQQKYRKKRVLIKRKKGSAPFKVNNVNKQKQQQQLSNCRL